MFHPSSSLTCSPNPSSPPPSSSSARQSGDSSLPPVAAAPSSPPACTSLSGLIGEPEGVSSLSLREAGSVSLQRREGEGVLCAGEGAGAGREGGGAGVCIFLALLLPLGWALTRLGRTILPSSSFLGGDRGAALIGLQQNIAPNVLPSLHKIDKDARLT